MGERMSRAWSGIRDAFEGWRAIAVTAVVASGLTAAGIGLFSDLLAAPQMARTAVDSVGTVAETARDNRRDIRQLTSSVSQLERTVRIFACTRNGIDRTLRIRLDCRELER